MCSSIYDDAQRAADLAADDGDEVVRREVIVIEFLFRRYLLLGDEDGAAELEGFVAQRAEDRNRQNQCFCHHILRAIGSVAGFSPSSW
jgi:hypothetical protein